MFLSLTHSSDWFLRHGEGECGLLLKPYWPHYGTRENLIGRTRANSSHAVFSLDLSRQRLMQTEVGRLLENFCPCSDHVIHQQMEVVETPKLMWNTCIHLKHFLEVSYITSLQISYCPQFGQISSMYKIIDVSLWDGSIWIQDISGFYFDTYMRLYLHSKRLESTTCTNFLSEV